MAPVSTFPTPGGYAVSPTPRRGDATAWRAGWPGDDPGGHLGLDVRQLGGPLLRERGETPLARALRCPVADGRAQCEPLPVASRQLVRGLARAASSGVRDGGQ